jgi:hypothetical protein
MTEREGRWDVSKVLKVGLPVAVAAVLIALFGESATLTVRVVYGLMCFAVGIAVAYAHE